MSYQVKTEKLIKKPASEVFQALKEGKLFMNCGSDSNTMKIDFRVGGKYEIAFKKHTLVNFGEFLEIIPNQKLVFTWCQSFGADQKPDTQVLIELFEDGPQTKLVLLHTGFKTQEISDNHKGGWTDGVTDFAEQVQNGRLRFLRRFDVPVEKLYDTCKNPASFFAFMGDLNEGNVEFKVGGKFQVPNDKDKINGEFLEIIPNQKITFSWLTGRTGPLEKSKVSLVFSDKGQGVSALEIIHEGLLTGIDQKDHRSGWESVTKKLSSQLG